MAELYSEKDIVRHIVEWGGYCKPISESDPPKSFGDLSPACVGLAVDDPRLESLLAIFNPQENSYRVFNEIHVKEGDKFLTIGCGHFTKSSIEDLFLKMPDGAWKEFRTYVAKKLHTNKDYFTQFSQDYVVSKFLDGIDKSEREKEETIAASLDFFFGRAFTFKGKNYPNVKKSGEITSRYQYYFNPKKNKYESWTISNKIKSYLTLWADTVLLLSTIDPKTGKPPKQFDVYPNYSGDRPKIACTKFADGEEDTSVSPVCVRLFPGFLKDNGKCNYWFYKILQEALLIKSVANWQHKIWVDDYYTECAKRLRKLAPDADVRKNELPIKSILTGLVSWKSNGITLNAKPPFIGVTEKEDWRNMGNLYYLESSTKVLINKKVKDRDDKQRLIDSLTDPQNGIGELFTGLIIWVGFNMTKTDSFRSRQRVMWSSYFNVKFQEYKDDPSTKVEAKNIEKTTLEVTTDKVILTITEEKPHRIHKYTFLDISKKNTTTP